MGAEATNFCLGGACYRTAGLLDAHTLVLTVCRAEERVFGDRRPWGGIATLAKRLGTHENVLEFLAKAGL